MSAIKGFIMGFIPRFISDRLVMAVWRLTNIPVGKKRRSSHLSVNKKNWACLQSKASVNGFIEKQDLLSDMVLGNAPASYNCCEVIAVYNAMLSLKDKLSDDDGDSFPKLLGEFEKNGLAMGGKFGSTPNVMLKILKKRGFCPEVLYSKAISPTSVELLSKRYHVFIATVYNDKRDISKMIHTVCITRSKEGFIIHNSDVSGTQKSLYDSLFVLNGSKSRPISLIAIR